MSKKKIKQFILYTGASGVAMLVDLVIFTVLVYIILARLNQSLAIFLSSIIARVTSGLVNFMLSKKAFESDVSKRKGIPKYFFLGGCQLLISAGLVILICHLTNFSKTITKCAVDLSLYLIFYKIQLLFIFQGKKAKFKELNEGSK